MNISVIGGSGFVGTRLVSRLIKDGINVKIVDIVESKKYPSLFEYGDVRELDSLTNVLKGSDLIINLAAEHRDDVYPISRYDNVNVNGARNVCKAANILGINRIIFTSSVAVYGETKEINDESAEFNYFNDYGRTKKLAEDEYIKWYENSKKKNSLVIIRPTVIFGEENRGNVYNLLHQIAKGFFPMVGSGKNVKSMAYVENVAAFLEFSSKAFGDGLYCFNYVDKPDYDMNTLVAKINKYMGRKEVTGFHWPYWFVYLGGLCFDLLATITGKKLPISSIRVKKFCMSTQFTSSSMIQTGFIPPVSLDHALENTIRYEFLDK